MTDFNLIYPRKGTNSVKWDTQKFKFGVDDLTAFWIADMDFPVALCITEALKERIGHPIFGYTSPSFQFRKAFCRWYLERHDFEISPDWIVPAANTITAMSILLQGLTAPEDRCLILPPVYDAFSAIIRSSGRTLVQLPLREKEGSYSLDMDALEQELSHGVRCLIFCNPHNPCGKVWEPEELDHIAQLCKTYHVLILSDDVHCDWCYAPHRYRPLILSQEARENTILFTAPSKTFNLAGLGASTLIIPDENLRKQSVAILEGAAMRGSNLFAYTAMEAAYMHGGEWLDAVRSYVEGNINTALSRLQKEAPCLSLRKPDSTFMLWIDCRASGLGSQEIVRQLAQEYGISVNAGNIYGHGGDGFIRLNVACPASTLEIGLSALSSWYRDHF